MKKQVLVLGMMVGCVGLLGLGGGCAFIPKQRTVTTYNHPNWGADGGIIAIKNEIKMETTFATNEHEIDRRVFIVRMNEDGTEERKLKELEEIPSLIAESPKGGYMGYIADNQLVVLDEKTVGEVGRCGVGLFKDQLEFSSDEAKVCLAREFAEFKVFTTNGSHLITSSKGAPGVWGLNDVLYAFNNPEKYLEKTDLKGNVIATYNKIINPEKYLPSSDSVAQDRGDELWIYSLTTGETVTQNLSYDHTAYSGKQIRNDGQKMVMGGQGFFGSVGIYVMDIKTSTLTPIR
jgi:hypothetical protein